MSHKALIWAFDQLLPPTDKLALIILGYHADRDHRCAVAVQKIVVQSGMCRRTVQRCLRDLEHGGLIQRHNQKHDDGGQLANRYTLVVAAETSA